MIYKNNIYFVEGISYSLFRNLLQLFSLRGYEMLL